MSDSRILLTYPQPHAERLPEMCDTLLDQQRSSWPELSWGYEARGSVGVREIRCDGYSVKVQYNPRRLASTSAKVDKHSVSARRCFLCLDNLPPEQKGILYRDKFFILCNPAPIFDRHLTIAHRDHTPQTIAGNIQELLGLARDLSPQFTVFYNGPKCGASAPDHLHFQACPSGAIPIERDVVDPARRKLERVINTVSVYTIRNLGRPVIVIDGSDDSRLLKSLDALLGAAREITQHADEPMVNLLCSFVNGVWLLTVFLRRKHRPGMYLGGDERVMISPAAVDVGGLIITPIEKDFERVDADMVQKIYDEVMLDEVSLRRVIAAM